MSPLLDREDFKGLKASFFSEVLAVLVVQKRCYRDGDAPRICHTIESWDLENISEKEISIAHRNPREPLLE